ncbi:hypothetical protein I3843_12G137200 [Carya illinoinensis]|uniref:Uncharacterized protein n=1 Tax=Carya illinoinensis TaxID=32201 RepID=A0A922DKG1_CARIL|nr:hypothetical protein I3760_12G135000 [Carya illinoinensis]KAG6685937.1 hypothetical protein I3842_12G136900 [Carya illinoinensis]KAG7953975.1 hypothetical protein I3843_12G137200 [Carya illinoinensis]
MFLAEYVFLIAIWLLSAPKLGCLASGEVPGDVIPSPIACMNCTLCQSLCQAPAPPPPSGYPSYETPPPPAPPLSDQPTYEAPPPPPPQLPAQGICPPTPVVQCCQYPPPTTYGYVPYDNYSASSPSPISLFPCMMSVFSYAVLFQV